MVFTSSTTEIELRSDTHRCNPPHSKPHGTWRYLACCATLLCVLSHSAQAQKALPSPATVATDVIEVELVSIDVFLDERRARRAVKAEDVVVREDGRPVEVVAFERRTGLEHAIHDGAEPTPRATLVIYLDEALTSPADIARLTSPLVDFLHNELPQATQLVLARHADSLEIVVPPTRSIDAVVAGLEGLALGAGDVRNRSARDRTEDVFELQDQLFGPDRAHPLATDGVPCGAGWRVIVANARSFAQEATERLRRSSAALHRLVTGAGGIEGRKALLFISGGLQMRPGSEVFHRLSDRCPERQSEVDALLHEYQQIRELNKLAAHANAHRVTIYSLDAIGLREGTRGTRQAFQSEADLLDGLVLLARETGGRSILNERSFQHALQPIARDFESHYQLAYRPASGGHGHGDRIVDVRMRRGKQDLRYRRTIARKSVDERRAERLFATLLLGVERNPIQAELTVGVPHGDGNAVELPLHLRIPADQVERSGALGQSLSLLLMVENANYQPVLRQLQLDPIPVEDSWLEMVIKVPIRSPSTVLAMAIHDDIGGTASYLRREFDLADSELDPRSALGGHM